MPEHAQTSTMTGLDDYVRVLRRRRLLIVFTLVVFLLAALIYSSAQPQVYESETSLSFQDPTTDAQLVGVTIFSGQTPEERAAQGARVVTRSDIVSEAKRRARIGADETVEISASAESRTNLVVVRTRAEDPARAAQYANAAAQAAVIELRRDFRREVDRAIDVARDELAASRLTKEDVELLRIQARQQLARLRAIRRLGQPVTIAKQASAQNDPVAPKPIRNALLGLVAGLTVGLLLAFGREALDRRLRTSEEMREVTGMPVLGHVRERAFGLPWLRSDDARTEADIESFSIMRTNLQYLAIDNPPSTLLVTSALPAEGKSTVSASLAFAAAVRGERALVIECDLRRPTIAERLGIEAGPGITDYLAGRATPQECVQVLAVPVPGTADDPDAEPRRMAVMTAGSAVPNPTEVLRSERFGELLRQVSEVYDLVVIDSPPLLPVADGLELARRVDAIVLCVRAGSTRKDELRAARRLLEQIPDKPAGIVVSGSSESEEPGYGAAYYSYAYGRS